MQPVLITQRLVENTAYPETRECLDVQWGLFSKAVGLLPVPILANTDAEQYFSQFNPAGVILSGGNDLGEFSDDPLSKRRDELEDRIVKCAFESRLPVLGVCRGMQFLASQAGIALKPVTNHVATRHGLNVDGNAKYGDVLSGLNEVNSYHQYGFTETCSDFRVLASAPDGVIEAMMHAELPMMGIMWHPEREDSFAAEDVDLFRRFFGVRGSRL